MDPGIVHSQGRWRRRAFGLLALLCAGSRVYAGPYAPAADQVGSTAIPNSFAFTDWASSVQSITRGPQNISSFGSPLVTFGDPTEALGPAEGNSFNVVSLGDGGQITLAFPHGIRNGAGADFAVFENGITDNFLELGFVEVSSDGLHFFRFPSVSLTSTATQVGTFGSIDPTDIYDLAGKYRQGFGTPFDLEELKGVSPFLDVNNVQRVRVVDVVGSINPAYGTRDSLGNLVNDPFTTDFSTGGFDLDGIGVINSAPEPACLGLIGVASVFALRRSRGGLVRSKLQSERNKNHV